MLALVAEPAHELPAGAALRRHLHATAYATLVLDGGYEEAGEQGRWHLQPGDAVIHAPFSIHRNRAFHRGARLINLLLPASTATSGVGTVDGLDDVIRLAKRDATEAAKVLCAALRSGPKAMDDVPDLLARSLVEPSASSIQGWSVAHGITRQTTFRSFRKVYGAAPTRYRTEARARRAWRHITTWDTALAAIAIDCGYVDQAHMSREVKALTGRSPGAWRRWQRLQQSCKTGALTM